MTWTRTHPRRLATTIPVAALLAATLLLPAAGADEPAPFRVDAFALVVHIHDDLAVTTASLTVANPGDDAREISLDLPLSTHAVLTNFTLTTHNRTLVGVVLERQAATTAYEEAKARGEDTVLLTSAGKGRLAIDLHVAAASTVRLDATYAEALPLEDGRFTYRFPLAWIGTAYGDPERFSLEATIQSTHGWTDLAATGLPSEPIAESPHHATWRHEDTAAPLTADLTLAITPAATAYEPSMVAARRADEAAFLLNLVPPGFADPLPLDVVFVLDRSGSMSGDKILQARQALVTILDQLRAHDRFGLVAFDDQIESYAATLRAPIAADRDAAQDWVRGIDARSATDIEASLSRGLDLLRGHASAAVPTIVLITDGQPTAGITAPHEIIASIDRKNDLAARIHTIGIGFDQDDAFLGELAAAHRGFYQPVDADAAVASTLEGFYNRIATPVLKDVEVAFEGLDAHDVHPDPLPDVYQGSSLLLAGRADLADVPPTFTLVVTGTDATGPVTLRIPVNTTDMPLRAEVDRLWARQKAATLERHIQLNEPVANVTSARAELLALGIQYQIETLATAWVILDLADTAEVDVEVPVGPEGPVRFRLDAAGGATGTFAATRGIIATTGAPAIGDQATQTPGPAAWLAVLAAAFAGVAWRRRR